VSQTSLCLLVSKTKIYSSGVSAFKDPKIHHSKVDCMKPPYDFLNSFPIYPQKCHSKLKCSIPTVILYTISLFQRRRLYIHSSSACGRSPQPTIETVRKVEPNTYYRSCTNECDFHASRPKFRLSSQRRCSKTLKRKP
jgi:hypothetical protein